MKFAGDESKLNVGDKCAWLYCEGGVFKECEGKVTDIGILGGKLGDHAFLYTVELETGETIKTTEHNLIKK